MSSFSTPGRLTRCRFSWLPSFLAALLVFYPLAVFSQGLEEKPFSPTADTVKGMAVALSDADEQVAAYAAHKLGDWRRAEVAAEMAKLLGPETPAAVRDAALLYFTRIGESARPHLDAVVRQLPAEHAHIRELVLVALMNAKACPAYLEQIVPLLKDPRVSVRSLAASCLGQAGEAARMHLPALREALRNARTSEFRRAVLTALEDVGDLSLADGESFLPFLRDQDDAVRVAAFGAIEVAVVNAVGGDSAGKAKDLGDAAMAQFASENEEVRAAMLDGAVHSRRLALGLMDELAARVKEESSEVRAAALTALSVAGEDALPKLSIVVSALDDPESSVRAAAYRALRMMGPKAVTPHLNTVARDLRHASPLVRNEALLALPLAGDTLRNFPYRIRTAILDADPGTRNTLLKAAAIIVEQLGVDEEWMAECQSALASSDPSMRAAMCYVASRFGMKNGALLFPGLVALLEDPKPQVRGAAALALRSFATNEPQRAILRAAFRPLLKDAEADVRWAALDTLFELEPAKDPGLVGEIAALLEDEDEGVHGAAIRALGAGGAAARPFLPRVIRFLTEDPTSGTHGVADALFMLSPLSPQELALLLQVSYTYPEELPFIRATAYGATSGEPDRMLIVRLIGRSSGSVQDLVQPVEAGPAIAGLQDALKAKGLHPKLKIEIESRLSELEKLAK